jgi:hypothetical protein
MVTPEIRGAVPGDVFGRSLPRALITITKMERRHLRESHFYDPPVGVAPEGQGA